MKKHEMCDNRVSDNRVSDNRVSDIESDMLYVCSIVEDL